MMVLMYPSRVEDKDCRRGISRAETWGSKVHVLVVGGEGIFVGVSVLWHEIPVVW